MSHGAVVPVVLRFALSAALLRLGFAPCLLPRHFIRGCPPHTQVLPSAAAAGHSRVAALVLDALPSRAAAYAKSTSGKTFADLLRENDMAGAARRLEKQADEKWGAA